MFPFVSLIAACGSGSEEGTAGTTGGPVGAGGAGVAGAGVAGGPGGVAGATGVPTAGATGGPVAGAGVAGAGAGGTAGPGGTADIPAEYYGEVVSPAGIAPDCQGFKLDGLRYSPGGMVLPNKCEPYHHFKNNPWAVRCIDAWSHYNTGWASDEYCILPPPPDKGTQFGVHPQGPAWYEQSAAGDFSGYMGVAPDPWTITPGIEQTRDFATRTDNETDKNYYRAYYRMRYGSHHNIITAHTNSAPGEVWLPGENRLPGDIDFALGPTLTGLGGAQRPDDGVPISLEKPPEDTEIGLYRPLPKGGPGGAYVIFNLHHFNPTDKPILKEVWVNFWYEDDARTNAMPISSIDIGQVLFMGVPAGQTVDVHYVNNITRPWRALQFFGHRHGFTPNFSAWVVRAGGATEVVYQSFDWGDVPTYRYDSTTQNPVPDAVAKADGGSSGVLLLNPGDKLHYNCHITFTDARAASEGLIPASQIGSLKFANEAFDAEMCILFGAAVHAEGGSMERLGGFIKTEEPVPDFAK
jgi:hypothetical protein